MTRPTIVAFLAFCLFSEARVEAQPLPDGEIALPTPSVSLTSRTSYHAFSIALLPSTPHGGRRQLNRFAQALDGGVFSLAAGDVDAVVSLRYTTDFGTGFRRDTPVGAGIPAVDGRDNLDLLFLFADWRALGEPIALDLRFGRQLVMDDLAWYGLDGLKGTVRLIQDGPRRVDLDAYVGVPVAFDRALSSSALLADGLEIYDGRGWVHGLVFGGALRTRAIRALSASLSYRQAVVFRGDDLVSFADPESGATSFGTIGLAEHLVGASVAYDVRPIDVSVQGHLTWDLLLGILEQARLGAQYDPTPSVHAGCEYLRSRPRFVGDSIFNFFHIFGYDRGRIEASVEPIEGVVLEAGYFVQKFGGGAVAGGATYRGSDLLHGPSAGVTFRRDSMGAGAYLEASTNFGDSPAYGGNYRFGEIFGDLALFDRRVVADLRFSITSARSDWSLTIDSGDLEPTPASYRLGAGLTIHPLEFVTVRAAFAKNFDAVLDGGYSFYDEISVRY